LRGLLRAYLAVAHADDLDTALKHIVGAARELVDARYAALVVTFRPPSPRGSTVCSYARRSGWPAAYSATCTSPRSGAAASSLPTTRIATGQAHSGGR